MKKWNAPEIAELDMNETAGGCVDFFFETCLLFNDDLLKCPTQDVTPDPDPQPETPDHVDQLS